jgi:hypothetical protein
VKQLPRAHPGGLFGFASRHKRSRHFFPVKTNQALADGEQFRLPVNGVNVWNQMLH